MITSKIFILIRDSNPQIENAENGGFCVSESPQKNAACGFSLSAITAAGRERKAGFRPATANESTALFLVIFRTASARRNFSHLCCRPIRFTKRRKFLKPKSAAGALLSSTYRGYQDLFVFADGEQPVRTEFFDTDFRFLWARLSEGERLPEEYRAGGRDEFCFRRERNRKSSAKNLNS